MNGSIERNLSTRPYQLAVLGSGTVAIYRTVHQGAGGAGGGVKPPRALVSSSVTGGQ